MADSNFRPYRSRDPAPSRSAETPARAQPDDPLAELARLIGQSDPVNDYDRGARNNAAPAFDEQAAGDWEADERYAEPSEETGEAYDARYDERYAPPRAEPPAYRSPPPQQYDRSYAAPPADQFAEPEPRLDMPRQNSRGYAAQPPAPPARYRGQQETQQALARPLPSFLPRTRDDRYDYDGQAQEGGADDQAYAADDYEEEAPRRRSGFVVIAAVLGLAVLGTAGAFAYRAMFGGSMMPALPPIIKADDGPNKIVPNTNTASTSAPQDASNSNSGEKLVSRQEQPVDMPSPVNPAPRVVSTIPIFPDPNSAQAGNVPPPPAPAFPVPAAPIASAPPPAPAVAQPPSAVAAAAPMGVPAPKKIHTVAVGPDQMNGPGPNVATTAQMPVTQSLPMAAPAPRAVRPAPAPRANDPNAPLSIVPGQSSAAPPPPMPVHTHTAMAEPTPTASGEAATSSSSGGYAVQVTSQRSAAEAKSAFQALAAKYPDQLGGHQPMVKRADLGDKGIYYRALVGPYASMEQAASMCSNLKAAGGNCIVQKN